MVFSVPSPLMRSIHQISAHISWSTTAHVGRFQLLFLAKVVQSMLRQNWVASFWRLEELSASCKRIQSHPWSNWLRQWLARLEDCLTEVPVPQQDGNKHRGLFETCRPLCMPRFALWLPMPTSDTETLKSPSTVHYIHGFSNHSWRPQHSSKWLVARQACPQWTNSLFEGLVDETSKSCSDSALT